MFNIIINFNIIVIPISPDLVCHVLLQLEFINVGNDRQVYKQDMCSSLVTSTSILCPGIPWIVHEIDHVSRKFIWFMMAQ